MTFAEKTVREIALESPASVRVFEEFKIDYCCGGGKSLTAACQAAEAAPEVVQQMLNAVIEESKSSSETKPPEYTSATELIRYILDRHHVFAKREMERLAPLMEKVSGKHGARHPELNSLRKQFEILVGDLNPHMHKEEAVLFPFIESLDSALSAEVSPPAAPFGTIQNPIRMMMFEHETAGTILKAMRKLANDYKAPADACPSYNALYFGLEELERDLHMHIHLENNVLFPMAAELETAAA